MEWLQKHIYTNKEYTKASYSTLISELFRLILKSNFPEKDQTFFINIFILWIHYTLDILWVKSFDNEDINNKLTWYTQSFFKFNFVKYVITISIHLINTSFIKKYIDNVLDEKKILTSFKYRNLIVTSIINFFSFGLYMYFLKFKWAYVDDSDITITMIVLCWSSILLILYMLTTTLQNKNKK